MPPFPLHPATSTLCRRCQVPLALADAELCWRCHGPLCYACWDGHGHCGHPGAEEANDLARERTPPPPG